MLQQSQASKIICRSILSDLNLKVFFSKKRSIFRYYQDRLLEKYGKEFTGELIELGCEKSYEHKRYLPNIENFRCTNISRDHDEFLDVTALNLKDNSVDGFLCVSVLEHVYDIKAAISEIERTLKPGGKILLVIPFAYPYHDQVDYWRLSVDAYLKLFENFEVKAFVHLGGLFSTIIDNLKRPKDKINKRYFFHKALALFILIFFKRFERLDGLPLGYGLYAIKRAKLLAGRR